MSTVKLTDTVALFPLHGTILLPGSVLPLHIFESRYRQMVEHVMENDDLLIGIIQPTAQDSKKLCKIGCAGSIEQSQQLPKGNYLIQLHGESRFHIVEELETDTPYLSLIHISEPTVNHVFILLKNLKQILHIEYQKLLIHLSRMTRKIPSFQEMQNFYIKISGNILREISWKLNGIK